MNFKIFGDNWSKYYKRSFLVSFFIISFLCVIDQILSTPMFFSKISSLSIFMFTITTIFLVAMMASIGAPGIPSGSMAGMQLVLLAVGIPLEAIALLLMIERPLDTFRTAVNVQGDLVGSLVVNKRVALQ